MKTPADCQNISEIRQAIDEIDKAVIDALGNRFDYVKAASKFKTNVDSVKAADRFATMLNQRRNWAEAAGLNPDVIETMYRDLVNYFIREELQHWTSTNTSGESE